MNYQILSGPASTRRLKANLGLAIDETMLTRKLAGLREQMQRLQNQPDQRLRYNYLKNEVLRIEKDLNKILEMASSYE